MLRKYGVCLHIIEGLKVWHSKISENEVIYGVHFCIHMDTRVEDVIALVLMTMCVFVL